MPRAKATRAPAAPPPAVVAISDLLDALWPPRQPGPLTPAQLDTLRAALRDPALPAGPIELRQAVYTHPETGQRHAGILARPAGAEAVFDPTEEDATRWTLAVFGGAQEEGGAWARLFFCFLEQGARLLAAAERDAARAEEGGA